MSLLAELSPRKSATQKRKRIGRGTGSGLGGTSGKGHKGQKARAGTGKTTRGFEGGQMPMAMRLPKFGFTNARFKVSYTILGLDELARYGGEVSPTILQEKGELRQGDRLKVLANGKLEGPVSVKAHKFSKAAKEAIEKAGGTAEVI